MTLLGEGMDIFWNRILHIIRWQIFSLFGREHLAM